MEVAPVNIDYDSGWVEVERSGFDALTAEAKVAHLERRLAKAQAEIDLLTLERDMALLDVDRWHQKYLIASGQGGF